MIKGALAGVSVSGEEIAGGVGWVLPVRVVSAALRLERRVSDMRAKK